MVVVMIPESIGVSVVVPVPPMIVLKASVVSIPIAGEELLPVVVRRNPSSAYVGRASPVPSMPSIMSVVGVPIAVDPDVVGPRTSRNRVHARRRRRPDTNAKGNLRTREHGSGKN